MEAVTMRKWAFLWLAVGVLYGACVPLHALLGVWPTVVVDAVAAGACFSMAIANDRHSRGT